MDSNQAEKVIKALGWDWDDAEFRMNVAELIGTLCLMNHWMRGMLHWLTVTGAVKFTPVQLENWNELLACLENTEETVWQLVPPRNMLIQIRALRNGEFELDPEWFELLDADGFGRASEDKQARIRSRVRSEENRTDDKITREGAPNRS